MRMKEKGTRGEERKEGKEKERESLGVPPLPHPLCRSRPLKVLLALVTLSASILVVDPLFFSLPTVFA